jgi:hypothetical protein
MEKEKMATAWGIYAGFLHPESGKLALTRRNTPDSIIPGKSFRGNWELIGGAVMVSDEESIPYNYYSRELTRLIEKKIGIVLEIPGLPMMYSTLFKGPAGYDEASVVPMVRDIEPTIGEIYWVSPQELQVLAEEFEPADESKGKSGKGLLSGYGKRMHCMALIALSHSPNHNFQTEALRMLREITANW